jgi:hypothetical protein
MEPAPVFRHGHAGLAMVLDWLRSVFGEASSVEIALVCTWFLVVVLYRQVPRLGEAIGGLFDRRDRQP